MKKEILASGGGEALFEQAEADVKLNKSEMKQKFGARKAGSWFGSNIISRINNRVDAQLKCNKPQDSEKQNIKIKAFTLAEVLITLVIIGVIAALTVPTLMANTQKQETSARLKKFYSNLSQAVRLAQVDSYYFMDDSYNQRYETYRDNLDVWWNANIKSMPITKVSTDYKKKCGPSSEGDVCDTFSPVYTLNDGSMIIYASSVSNGDISFLYDINGDKGPNRVGRDIFKFTIDTNMNSDAKWTKVCADDYCNSTNNRNNLINGCKSGYWSSCSALVQMDGWEIRSDYPAM